MLCDPDCPGGLCSFALKLPSSAFLALKSQKNFFNF